MKHGIAFAVFVSFRHGDFRNIVLADGRFAHTRRTQKAADLSRVMRSTVERKLELTDERQPLLEDRVFVKQ
jgi:hypothetical protein